METTADLGIFHILFLPVLGLMVGALGSAAGIGGGFILVPVLILLFPDSSIVTITSISLSVVFLNASSGTLGYIRQGRVDYKSAALFTLAAVPTAVVGAIATDNIEKHTFQLSFGILLIVGSAYLLWRARIMRFKKVRIEWEKTNRILLDKGDCIYRYYVNEPLGMSISAIAGGTSSFFGIGGGVVQMPAMVGIMKMPPPIAAATTQFVLIFTALAGVLSHVIQGNFHVGWRRAGLLGIGALVGAQIGVLISRRLDPKWIIWGLALSMVLLGIRQIATSI